MGEELNKTILTIESCDTELIENSIKSYISQTGRFPKGRWTREDIIAIDNIENT